MNELLTDKINTMADESYKQDLSDHLYGCEKIELLGHSNHIFIYYLLERKGINAVKVLAIKKASVFSN
jgi:hypothetical protein